MTLFLLALFSHVPASTHTTTEFVPVTQTVQHDSVQFSAYTRLTASIGVGVNCGGIVINSTGPIDCPAIEAQMGKT